MGEEEVFNCLMVAAAVIWFIIFLRMIFRAMLKGLREGAIEREEYRQRKMAWTKKIPPAEQASAILLNADDECLRPVTE